MATKSKSLKETVEANAPVFTELYGGKVVVKFYPISHQYWVSTDYGNNFKRRTGVTSICGVKDKSIPLGIWQQGLTLDFLLDQISKKVKIDEDKAVEAVIQHELYLEKAVDIGHAIHGYAEGYIRRKLKQKGFEKLPDMPDLPEALTGVNAFYGWEKERKIKWISTERVVYSLEHDFIGTLDLEAEIDGNHGIHDFKSSNGLYNGVRMQTAAYTMADIEERKASGKKIGKDQFNGRWAIRFSKYSEEEYYKRENRKKLVKEVLCRFKGKEWKDYKIKPYQVFEAQPLDADANYLERDFKAFLNAKGLLMWDRETDPYVNGGTL